ncbi:MAG: hypothetical protein A2045_04125 [Rhodocyclales bacterium GWA2_65_20]|nr:MAG: hypothetical protein A2045_04125 [Rhodocyclales bacterium GWA2_65_20]
MRPILTLALLALATSSYAAGDPVKGKALHDKRCVDCHIEQFGGDGNKVYTRPTRIVKDRAALSRRVAHCATQTGAKWFPDEEEDVAAYLNKQFYHFK